MGAAPDMRAPQRYIHQTRVLRNKCTRHACFRHAWAHVRVAQDDVDDSEANMKTFTGNNYEERALDEAFDAIVMFWHPVSDD